MTDSRISAENLLVGVENDPTTLAARIAAENLLAAVGLDVADVDARIAAGNLLIAVDVIDEDGPLVDDFTGANGDLWDFLKWSVTANGNNPTIQGNQGRLQGDAGVAGSHGRARGKEGNVPNQKATGTLQLTAIGEPCEMTLWLQGSEDWSVADPSAPTDGYGVRLPADSDTAELVVMSGSVETVLDTATWPRDLTEKEFLFRRQGANVGFKIWDVGGVEPDDFLLLASDTTLAPNTAGSFQLAYYCPTAPVGDPGTDVDDVNVDTDNTPFPSGGGGNRMGGTGAIRRSPNATPGR